MGAGELLRRLDRRVLPPLGRALVWCLGGEIRRRIVVTSGVVGSSALLAASVWAAHEPPTSHDNMGHVVRVGVAGGQSVESYASEVGRELDELTKDGAAAVSYALVSFTAYLAPERFGSLVRDVSVHRVYARVPLRDQPTDVAEITIRRMPGDLRAGMLKVADRKAAESASYRRDADKLTGSSDVERDRREHYRAKADLAEAEAEAYRSMCSCLYAAVVRGSAGVLERLAGAPGVRTVDPAPEVTDLNRAVFMPPLPESPGNAKPGTTSSASATPSGSPSETPSASPPESSPAPESPPSPSDSATGGPTRTRDGDGDPPDTEAQHDTGADGGEPSAVATPVPR